MIEGKVDQVRSRVERNAVVSPSLFCRPQFLTFLRATVLSDITSPSCLLTGNGVGVGGLVYAGDCSPAEAASIWPLSRSYQH